MKEHTDRQKACSEAVAMIQTLMLHWINSKPGDEAKAVWNRIEEKLAALESPITGFREPAGAGDVRAQVGGLLLSSGIYDRMSDFDSDSEAAAIIHDFVLAADPILEADHKRRIAPSKPAAPAVDVAVAQGEAVVLTNEEMNAITRERFSTMHEQYAEGFRRLMRTAIEANDRKRAAPSQHAAVSALAGQIVFTFSDPDPGDKNPAILYGVLARLRDALPIGTNLYTTLPRASDAQAKQKPNVEWFRLVAGVRDEIQNWAGADPSRTAVATQRVMRGLEDFLDAGGMSPEAWDKRTDAQATAAHAGQADAKDATDTLLAVLNVIGYTKEFAQSHPDMKVSESVKLFLASQVSAQSVGDAPTGIERESDPYKNVITRVCTQTGWHRNGQALLDKDLTFRMRSDDAFRLASKTPSAAAHAAPPQGSKTLPPKLTPEMKAAMAKAAREYMDRTGGNSPEAMYEAAFAAAPSQQLDPVEVDRGDWLGDVRRAVRVYAHACEHDKASAFNAAAELETLLTARLASTAVHGVAMLTDAEIIALNAGEVFFSETPTRFPGAGHGTQYHSGAPGLLKFARAVLAAASAVHAGAIPEGTPDAPKIEETELDEAGFPMLVASESTGRR